VVVSAKIRLPSHGKTSAAMAIFAVILDGAGWGEQSLFGGKGNLRVIALCHSVRKLPAPTPKGHKTRLTT
jgi:hypothetical protein